MGEVFSEVRRLGLRGSSVLQQILQRAQLGIHLPSGHRRHQGGHQPVDATQPRFADERELGGPATT